MVERDDFLGNPDSPVNGAVSTTDWVRSASAITASQAPKRSTSPLTIIAGDLALLRRAAMSAAISSGKPPACATVRVRTTSMSEVFLVREFNRHVVHGK